MVLLFAAALFASGTLLFLVQPMFARMVLPLLGGSPAVWNTAMLCYQILLLAGYLYAHGLTRWLSPGRQRLLHGTVMALTALALPIGIPGGWTPSGGAAPVPWLMAVMILGVGLPFFVVSTTTPLLQAWFARTADHATINPYGLYAASNAGSMLGLLAYPFLIEPRLSLHAQRLLWTAGYAALVLLVVACALVTARRTGSAMDELSRAPHSHGGLTWRRRAAWTLLAFIPSSLMLSVTMYMSTNIAPLPLLWVVPLAIYLLTFVVTFGASGVPARLRVGRAFPWLVLPLFVTMLADVVRPMRVLVGLHLAVFTIVAVACHGRLAQDSPESESLTEFYLWLSLGGALGGVFNALLAPVLFASVLEYPLVLVVAALAIGVGEGDADRRGDAAPAPATRRSVWPARMLDVAGPLALIPLVPLLHLAAKKLDVGSAAAMRVEALVIPALLCFLFAERRVRFALGLSAMIVAGTSFDRDRHVLLTVRSFFGVSRVMATAGGSFHALSHGSISHGAQSTDPARRREP